MNRLKPFTALASIIFLGTVLRFYHLTTEDLWLDEIHTIDAARQNVFTLLPDILENGVFPLYSILVHFLIRFFGESAFTVRLPACIFGILSIPLIFLIVRNLSDDRVGLWVAYFLAISPYHIFYSQEARAYTLMIFFILGMIYFFVNILETENLFNWNCFLFCEIFAAYAHWYSAIIVCSLNILIFWLWVFHKNVKIRPVHWVMSQAIYFIVIIPWFVTVLHYKPWLKAQWIPKTSPTMLLDTFNNFSTSVTSTSFTVVGLPAWIVWTGCLLFGLLMLSAIIENVKLTFLKRDVEKHSLKDYAFSFSLAIFILPIILFYLYSLRTPSYLSWRYLIIALPGFYLMSGLGLSGFLSNYVKYIILILITFVYGFCLYDYFAILHKPSLKKPAEYLSMNIQSGDGVMIIPSYWIKSFSYYNSNIRNIMLPGSPSDYEKDSQKASENYSRIWLVEVSPFPEKFPLGEYFQKQDVVLYSPEQQVRLILYSNPELKNH